MPLQTILIVGAGPSGLLLALLLSQSGINVHVFEKDLSPTPLPRAVFYNPVSQYEFQRAGILEDAKAAAFVGTKGVAWRDMKGGKVFGMPGNGGMLALTVEKLVGVVRGAVEGMEGGEEKGEGKGKRKGGVEIEWGAEVLGVGQEAGEAWVDVKGNGKGGDGEGVRRVKGDYVVGCDGARSVVRRCVFGEGSMKGFTWEKQLVAADVRYDFYSNLEDPADSNLFMDPERAWLAFRTGKDEGLWRVVYRDGDRASEDEIVARCPETLRGFIPGSPEPGQFEVVRVQPYKVHQRIVDKMRLGRIILASDAAHLCCPYGALGLNGGIADIGSLYDCLLAIHEGKADDSILDVYSDVRREKWKTIIDPQSQATMKFIFSKPEDVIPNHPIYRTTEMMKKDPEMAKKNAPNPLALRHDFSEHWRS